LTRTAKLLLALTLAVPVPVALASCGGDDSSEDPEEVIQAAFNNDTKLESGVIDVTAEFSAEGDAGGSFTASLSGPFQGDAENPDALPQLDLTASVSGEGGGQSIDFEGQVTVTEDNAYVAYNDELYEVGTENFAELKEGFEQSAASSEEEASSLNFQETCEQALEAQGGDPAACDVDVNSWFTDLSNDGTEDVGGAEATHISGNLDLTTMLSDLVEIGLSVPQAQAQAGGVTPELIQGQLGVIADAVEEASFDVYAATEDDTLRGLDLNLAVDPTAIPGAATAGISGVDASISFRLSDVGATQSIAAPSGDAKPIDSLLGGLGGLGALGGVPGGGSSIPEIPEIPGSGSGSGTANEITDCLAQANTTEEINACLGT
jgi:hypothetical protein